MNWAELFGTDLQAATIVVLNLVLIESLLSIDNAALLATLVMDLPENQRGRALRYGIIGAYVFRGICLLSVAYLYQYTWLKALGGLYLLWLAVEHFKELLRYGTVGYYLFKIATIIAFVAFDPHGGWVVWTIKALLGVYAAVLAWHLFSSWREAQDRAQTDTEKKINKEENPVYKIVQAWLGPFWATVLMLELLDLAFSLDNVFAAVAFTDKIGLICLGVFIGILAMRFAAEFFVRLMARFPFLEVSAYAVIAILGFKLCLSYACEYFHDSALCQALESHGADLITSLLTIAIFLVPVGTSLGFGFPANKK